MCADRPIRSSDGAEQLGAEADRLYALDDPIAAVFEAWSESARLADQVWRMEPESTK